ncbi:hypothetical protein DFH11DRAFT_1579941 [Phellopilus nigrolimitatus]|nr:hypothetical protein DFH11DRAFT_1579941 [Phellopilus nigrolimitatus]
MPSIPVDEQNHSLFYEDSGPPPTAEGPYTTLIIVHGTVFHGAIFRRLLPLAPRHQTRLVLVNRRDYPGSAPYTDDDLAQASSQDSEAQDAFARARGAEFAEFIKQFVENEKIPRASADRKRGGVVLMSWSAASVYTLPLLAYVDSIPVDTREALEPFLRSFIILDAPRYVIGPPPPAPANKDLGFLSDTSKTFEERVRKLDDWLAGYFTHKDVTSRNVDDLRLFPLPDSRMATTLAMSADEERSVTCYAAAPRAELPLSMAQPAVYSERVRRALFDDDLAKYWPRLEVDVIWCEHSPWPMVDAAWELEKSREKADEQGIKGRPLKVTMFPGANHFVSLWLVIRNLL